MKLQYQNIYMLGIGGIGMSALARYFKKQGCDVSGYDRAASGLTETMQEEGIHIHFIDDPEWIPEDYTAENTLVIITPAIPAGNRELKALQLDGYKIVKRSEVLGEIAITKRLIAIAGTHGKTTTSAYTTWLLKSCGLKIHGFVGGIMANFNTNIICDEHASLMVAEADEYDRSFLTLRPEIAIVTSTDADHLDIYSTRDNLIRAFGQFVRQIKQGGTLIYRYGIKLERPEHVKCISYGPEKEADVQITDIKVVNGKFTYSLKGQINLTNLETAYPGRHNIENATAAIIAAKILGVNDDELRIGIQEFKGVKRRFEYLVNSSVRVYIDDYAHHPEELKACITAVKELFPDKHITGIFQPHLYTRTRDFAMEFAESLNLLDEPILIPLYPAREEPIPGVNSDLILQKLKGNHRHVMGRDEVIAYIQKKKPEVLLTLGAGDIDQLTESLTAVMSEGLEDIL